MKRILVTALSMLFAILMGCDSEDTSTHAFTGTWTFSSGKALCSQIINAGANGEARVQIDTIKASVFEDDTQAKLIKTVTVPCSDSTFTVDELGRGSYFVLVEAMALDPTVTPTEDTDNGNDAGIDEYAGDSDAPITRAYFVSNDTVVVPTTADETIEFPMSINNGTIEVTWAFEGGGNCGSDWINVAKVSIELKGTSSLNNQSSGQLDCDVAGQKYLFEDLDWDIYTITVTGLDEAGAETFMGTFDEPVEVPPGTEISGRDGIITLTEIAK